MVSRLSVLTIVAVTTVAAVGAAQIPTQRQTGPRPGAPMVLVATPYTVNVEDSSVAVRAGVGLRERIRRNSGRDYAIVSRDKMNEALETYGYPSDALLNTREAGTLAIRSGSRMLIYPLLTRNNTGGHRLTARFTAVGSSYGAGHVVTVERSSGERPEAMGERAADDLRTAFRAMNTALECYNNAATDQNKAIAAAERATREIPNFGAAEFCWGEILRSRDSMSTQALTHYQNAVKSDPMALEAYARMGSIYHMRGDSSQVITTYQTMLEVDPLNQELRENAFKLFQIYGRPTAAEEVADAGIKRDPNNTDWYDLKSNACLMQEKYSCAIDELERLWTVDSTRADSSFFSKITYATLNGADTTRFIKWAQLGVERYPEHQEILDAASRAYVMSGDPERAIAISLKLFEKNPYDLNPILRTANALAESGEPMRVLELVEVVKSAEDEDGSNTLGQILVNSASQMANDSPAEADTLSQAALDVGTTNPLLISYANYFIGRNMFDQVRVLSQSVRQSRNCEDARAYLGVLERAKPALEAAGQSPNEAIRGFSAQTLGPVNQELGVVPDMITSFCR